MWAVILILSAAAAALLIIPFSPTGAEFKNTVDEKAGTYTASGMFTEEDIIGLPLPVQRYFRYCGYLGTIKMSYMKAALNNVDFFMSRDKIIKIDYEQFNLTERPERYALISSRLFGIPFEGLDSYYNGEGSMKGVFAKFVKLFDQKGESMDRACLVTWLAESLMVPNAALQSFVEWESVDETHARAKVSWEGIYAEGMFSFDKSGELIEFRTKDRAAVDMDGKETKAEWSAFFLDYHLVDGILQPGVIQSVWHYNDGDCIYFNQNRSEIKIRYQ